MLNEKRVWYWPSVRADSIGTSAKVPVQSSRPNQFSAMQSVDADRKKMNEVYDIIIIGAGVVGLSTARELKMRHPSLKIAILEKECEVASHQSGSNSGVIHCGIYYPPHSFKSKMCVQGNSQLYNFCDQYKIPYKKCGKLIVAVDPQELSELQRLYQNGLTNNVPGITWLETPEEIQAYEPLCTGGLKAIYCPTTGLSPYL
ncbi:hypothetical protein RFI_30966 [Reticulomyxa filosa]|uniref:L-2-hydroxyglutarate dehydrogenase, mitochondrial n=1 Tax=Reticulomyxa filosa TaxID=46433 RepID=X6LXW2_RETFI|nr:hypothetical protein RFI_30966 [Reticulomyxa filosa]|eukprot:ETO06434.1 hypothetical protein RFI_30966 [Reticulomyxa filosa]